MFNRLHIYTIHINPKRRDAHETPVFLREGFNWWAFVLTLLWSFYNRLWLVSAAMLAFYVAIAMMQEAHWLSSRSGNVLMLAMQIIVGFHGNDWLRAKYAKRGWVVTGIATGDNLLRAEQRYFEQHVGTLSPAA